MDEAMAMRADDAAALLGSERHAVGRAKWVLLSSLTAVFFVLLALYCGVLSVLLPNQIEALDYASKARDLAIVFAVTSVFSTLATPLAGALSDRTHSRFGRRTPWIVLGALIGAGCLFAVSQVRELWLITTLWVVAAVALNSMQAAITTVVADRFRAEERGTASGFVGAGMTAGGTVGIVLAGSLAAHITLAYALFAGAIALVCLLFVVLNPEPRATKDSVRPRAPLDLRSFLKSFWISPRDHPDFAWAFLGRFTIYMGYQGIVTYLLYILQDHIHLSVADSNRMIATLSSVTFVALVFSGFGSGLVSDAIGRRKPLVFLSSLIMGVALVVPLLWPTIPGMYAYAVLIGLGYGAFMSVDMALMTQVLPKAASGAAQDDATGKDLGILTTAVNIPQILSPVLAAWMLAVSGNDYRVLFVAAILFVFAGSMFVLPIRSVK